MFNFIQLAAATSTGTGAKQNPASSLILMAVLFGAMYFLMIRPQKKKQKEEQNMRDSIQIGDEITTIGGIIGRVVTVKEDSIVVETGADRVKLKMQRWAIQTNETANARMEAEKKAAEDAKKAKDEKAAIDEAVNGRHGKRKEKVKNKGTVEEFKAEEDAAIAEAAEEITEAAAEEIAETPEE